MSSGSSLRPGTRTKRSQIGRRRAASRRANSSVGADLLGREAAIALRIPALDVEQHEVDRLEIGVGEPVAEEAVGVERGVDPHPVCRGEELQREAVLHQRLAATQA